MAQVPEGRVVSPFGHTGAQPSLSVLQLNPESVHKLVRLNEIRGKTTAFARFYT